MPYLLALWNQTDRNITAQEAFEIFETGRQKNPLNLPALPNITEMKGMLAELIGNNNPVQVLIESKNFMLMELKDGNSLDIAYDLLFYALDNDLLLYSHTHKQVLCVNGRYGTGDYVLTHESVRIIDNPAASAINTELKMLDGMNNTFAILEGPEGYVQTAYDEETGYTAEWNKGDLGRHFTLDKGETDLEETVKIFTAFLNGDMKTLDTFQWCKIDFTGEDFEQGNQSEQ